MNLVTGGAGFIGSHLVEALVRAGENVRVLDDLSSGHEENLAAVAGSIEFVRGSVADPAAVRAAMAGVARVFHLAARPSVVKSFEEPEVAHEANATGTLHVAVEAARAGAARLVFAGSCAVYGDGGPGAIREEQRTSPQSPYAVQKLLGEHYCRLFGGSAGMTVVVLRFFNVFGPRQDPASPYSGVVSVFARRLLRGEPATIFGDGRQTRDFVAVDDVVAALLLAGRAPSPRSPAYNIASGASRSVLDLFTELARATNSPAAPCYAPARRGEIVHSAADIARARAELGYSPAARFGEALARTLAWVRGRGGG
jgi:UDP-glucose 4-epimerase